MANTRTIPVHKNENIDLKIDGLTHEGQGVGRYQGYTLFVKHALPGEKVRAKVMKTKKNFGFARLMEIEEPSPHRVQPPCPIFDQCGGCQLQHLAYDEQLRQKTQLVRDSLERIADLDLTQVQVHETLGMDDPWRYRNKAQVPIGEEEGGLIGGFYRQGSHQIIDMEACLIQHEQNDASVQKVKELAQEAGLKAYDEQTGKGFLRHVVVKYGFHTNQLMVIFITNGNDFPHKKKIVAELCQAFPNLKSVVQNVNTHKTNVIFGNKTKVLWGEEYIYDQIGDIRFAISPRSFYQVNPTQTEKLYQTALDYAELQGNETVIDAYCGIGTISLFLAPKAERVIGVEVVPEAVEDAKRNADLNGMNNAEFYVGKAEELIPRWQKNGMQTDVMVVDPPRKGCAEPLLQTMLDMQPEKIVYVSCNPATLARDLKVLGAGGYRTRQVQPVDMFPQTNHVEAVTVLEKRFVAIK